MIWGVNSVVQFKLIEDHTPVYMGIQKQSRAATTGRVVPPLQRKRVMGAIKNNTFIDTLHNKHTAVYTVPWGVRSRHNTTSNYRVRETALDDDPQQHIVATLCPNVFAMGVILPESGGDDYNNDDDDAMMIRTLGGGSIQSGTKILGGKLSSLRGGGGGGGGGRGVLLPPRVGRDEMSISETSLGRLKDFSRAVKRPLVVVLNNYCDVEVKTSREFDEDEEEENEDEQPPPHRKKLFLLHHQHHLVVFYFNPLSTNR
jgi:hypothetical protein